MKRITCRISLTLTVATIIAWAASYFLWAHIVMPLPRNNAHVSLHQVRGHVQLNLLTHYPEPREWGWEWELLTTMDARFKELGIAGDRLLRPSAFEFDDMDVIRFGGSWRMKGYTAGVPHWLLVIAFSSYPLIYWIRECRKPPGGRICSSCGYDLRGSPLGGSCPECGFTEPTISPEGP